MSAPFLAPALFLSIAILLLAIGAALALGGAARRRTRRGARLRARDLEQLLVDHLHDLVPASELRRAARACDEGTFWTALEVLSIPLRPADRIKISRVLMRNRHEAAERRALGDDSPWRRELAARRLSLVGSPASRRALRRALAEGPEMVTLAAAIGLARQRDAPALRWVLDHAAAFATRRPAARTALLRAFGRGALPHLAEALERGPLDPGLERAVIETLGLSRQSLAVAAIERRLRHADLEVRVAAARALGRIEAGECGGSLIAALRDDEWQVRALAAWALGRARVPTAIAPLAARLSDRSWWVRRHAAYALAALGHEGRLALRRVSEASPDPYARDIALEALASSEALSA